MPNLAELDCRHGVEKIIRTKEGYECVDCLREVLRSSEQVSGLRMLWKEIMVKLDPSVPEERRIIGIINQMLQERQR